MLSVEPLQRESIAALVDRVASNQIAVSARHPLIDGYVDQSQLTASFDSSAADVVVAVDDGRIVGHLRGTLLDGPVFGRAAWMNPDGVSYDSDRALEMLYVAQADRWLAEGYDRHYVWLPLERGVEPWLEMGFSFMHQRGTRTLRDLVSRELPDGYLLRRGTIADLAIALELDDHLRLAQEEGPSYAFGLANTGQRDDWIETLEDPEVDYVIVEANGEPVAQCATFEVPERLGSFARSVHLSAVSVVEAHRQKGVARAMVDQLLIEARQAGYEYVETNWRVTNRRAARYWMNYGFTPTYVRLHRHVGVG